MINHILAMLTTPQVLTTLYGFDEASLDPAASNTLCNAYMQLSASGTSIVSTIDFLNHYHWSSII